jgi:hypothetical protein
VDFAFVLELYVSFVAREDLRVQYSAERPGYTILTRIFSLFSLLQAIAALRFDIHHHGLHHG